MVKQPDKDQDQDQDRSKPNTTATAQHRDPKTMSRYVKSRSGCRVCKAKRLKCDEAVPACRNCINRGIACPGYRQVLRWSTKYEHPTAKAKAKGETIVAFPPGPSSSGGGGGGSGTIDAFSQFSELASAVTQSIKPGGGGGASSSTPRQPSMSPVAGPSQPLRIKAEQPMPCTQLAQVPPVPQLPPEIPPGTPAYGTLPMAASSPAVQKSPINNHHVHPLYTTSGPSPFYTPYTSSSDPVVGNTLARDDWGPGSLGDAAFDLDSIISSGSVDIGTDIGTGIVTDIAPNNGTDGNVVENDGEFTLELWQPGRVMELRRRQQQQQQQQQQHQQHMLSAASPPRSLTLIGTSLVELWFKSVCGMWAAMDSPSNPFRRLCSSLWSSNEAVFFSMQTMAAASLPKRPPKISEIVMVAPQMSTQALISELQELFTTDKGAAGRKKSFRFPSGLLTSLFCMSSSLSWIDARQLGIQYLRNARSVIDLIDLHADQLSAEDRELLEFFRGCLLYEEMVRSVVTDDQEDIQALLDWQPPLVNGGVDQTKDKASLGLHAWAGVPIVLVALFGKVMALCRRSRKRWRHASTTRVTYDLLSQSMRDIQEGQSLEQMLLSISIPSLFGGGGGDGNIHGTRVGEDSAPGAAPPPCSPELKSDIYNAAEAFRLLSLLQLYQTFPDLLSAQQQAQQQQQHYNQQQQQQQGGELPGGYPYQETTGSSSNYDGASSPSSAGLNNSNTTTSMGAVSGTSDFMMPMVMRVMWLLEAIPTDSPMRCLQPLLVICAGSGLRLDNDSSSSSTTSSGGMPAAAAAAAATGANTACMIGGASSSSAATTATATASAPTPSVAAAFSPTPTPGTMTAGLSRVDAVLQARASLSRRLCRLEQNLPPRPITVARQLLDMVWMRYDTDVPPSRSHWLDILADTDFESVFG